MVVLGRFVYLNGLLVLLQRQVAVPKVEPHGSDVSGGLAHALKGRASLFELCILGKDLWQWVRGNEAKKRCW